MEHGMAMRELLLRQECGSCCLLEQPPTHVCRCCPMLLCHKVCSPQRTSGSQRILPPPPDAFAPMDAGGFLHPSKKKDDRRIASIGSRARHLSASGMQRGSKTRSALPLACPPKVHIDKSTNLHSPAILRWQCADLHPEFCDSTSGPEHWGSEGVVTIDEFNKKQNAQGRWKTLKKNVHMVALVRFMASLRQLNATTQDAHRQLSEKEEADAEQEDRFRAAYEATAECVYDLVYEPMGDDDEVAPRPERPQAGPFGPNGICPSDFKCNCIPSAEGKLFPELSTTTGKEAIFSRDALMREVAAFLERSGGEWQPAESKWIVNKVRAY